MDIFGICKQCDKTEFADDLLEIGDAYMCSECYEELNGN